MSDVTPRRLYLMQVAVGTVPLPSGQALLWPVVCYLIEMSDGRHVLIDSGHPVDSQAIPGIPPLQQEKNVLKQLADLDVRPDDIDIVVCTHFDLDHAGYHDAFPEAEFIVQRAHYQLARSGHPRFAATRTHWDHPALRYRLLDGDCEILPGVVLLETSGHTTGHQSVLVRLPITGAVLLTIDAVILQRRFTPDCRATPNDENEEQLRASTQKLLALVERENVQLTIFGHDGEQWQSLKQAPAYYE